MRSEMEGKEGRDGREGGREGGWEEGKEEGEVCRIRRPCMRGVESAVAKEKIGECAVGD